MQEAVRLKKDIRVAELRDQIAKKGSGRSIPLHAKLRQTLTDAR